MFIEVAFWTSRINPIWEPGRGAKKPGIVFGFEIPDPRDIPEPLKPTPPFGLPPKIEGPPNGIPWPKPGPVGWNASDST